LAQVARAVWLQTELLAELLRLALYCQLTEGVLVEVRVTALLVAVVELVLLVLLELPAETEEIQDHLFLD